MIEDSEKLNEAIVLLSHPRSKQRESGAKRLRKLADHRAGTALLTALQKDIQDRRTWAAQYDMILALGFCEYRPALSLIWELARRDTEHTIL